MANEDYMDQFSQPSDVKDLGIIKVFTMTPRQDPKKPGRSLSVLFDARANLVPGFGGGISYAYDNQIHEPSNPAGNHYHKVKNEFMIVMAGSFEIKAEDIHTKEKQTVVVTGQVPRQVVYVKAEVAHSVRALEKNSDILVLATAPNNDGDEYPYPINW